MKRSRLDMIRTLARRPLDHEPADIVRLPFEMLSTAVPWSLEDRAWFRRPIG